MSPLFFNINSLKPVYLAKLKHIQVPLLAFGPVRSPCKPVGERKHSDRRINNGLAAKPVPGSGAKVKR